MGVLRIGTLLFGVCMRSLIVETPTLQNGAWPRNGSKALDLVLGGGG